jgi:non-ribosomal peptide synthetase component F
MSRLIHQSWNNTLREYLPAQDAHVLIEDQVARIPSAPALIMGEKPVSYRNLNDRANQLAYFLRTLGIGPDRLVGVCLN